MRLFGGCYEETRVPRQVEKLIMDYVRSITYLVLINGKHGDIIYPSRGLRQGDHLSPYLFILSAEGLSSMIYTAKEIGEIRRVSMKRGGILINHLMFADNCILLCRARVKEWLKFQDILHKHEKGSGQVLNKQKSSFLLSSNTRESDKRSITEATSGGVCGSYEKYLGLLAVWEGHSLKLSGVLRIGFGRRLEVEKPYFFPKLGGKCSSSQFCKLSQLIL